MVLGGCRCCPLRGDARRTLFDRYKICEKFLAQPTPVVFPGQSKEDAMDKIFMRLRLPEPKVRKAVAKAQQKHKDKSKYTRKVKRKGSWDFPGPLPV